MPPSPRAQRGYMYVGMAVWFVLRWIIYIAIYVMAFFIGGMQGPILERIRNIPLPRIQIKKPLGQIPLYDFRINYYTVLTGAFLTSAEASSHQGRLAASRIKSHVVIQNSRYYICVGNYMTAKEANVAFEKIRKKGYLNAIIAGPVQ
ncbi:MAG: SPOR domain-containing protein [bacterium]